MGGTWQSLGGSTDLSIMVTIFSDVLDLLEFIRKSFKWDDVYYALYLECHCKTDVREHLIDGTASLIVYYVSMSYCVYQLFVTFIR